MSGRQRVVRLYVARLLSVKVKTSVSLFRFVVDSPNTLRSGLCGMQEGSIVLVVRPAVAEEEARAAVKGLDVDEETRSLFTISLEP